MVHGLTVYQTPSQLLYEGLSNCDFFVVILLHQATSNLHYLVTFQGPTRLPFSEKQNIVWN